MSSLTDAIVDPGRHKWREVTGEPGQRLFVRHDYAILGHDLAAGTLDMLVRWRGDGGHCPIHRHVATTTVLVLAGEQHLRDLLPDGTQGPERVRRAGDYALTIGDPHPHFECGGAEGGLVFFGNHADDHRLYQLFDDDGRFVMDVTMELLIADWQENAR